jgi:hypothetical protein
MNRQELEPRLVHLIAGLRHHQVEEAVRLLLDYIDSRPIPLLGTVEPKEQPNYYGALADRTECASQGATDPNTQFINARGTRRTSY